MGLSVPQGLNSLPNFMYCEWGPPKEPRCDSERGARGEGRNLQSVSGI